MTAPLPRISYAINGVPLSTVATRIETAEGTQTGPELVGDNIPVWGRDGALNVYSIGQRRRPDGEGRITFALSLKGVNPSTGEFDPGVTLREYLDGVDRAVRLFYGRQLQLEATRPDGTVRRALGHLMPGESLDFTRERSSPAFGRYVAAIAIPDAHWADVDPVTTGVVSRTTGGTVSLAAFAAATAPCTDLEIVFGPSSNPRLSTRAGRVGWNGTITAGRQLLLATGTGLTSSGSGTAWTPGYASLDYAPGPGYFEVDPTEPLTATFTHTGGGSATVEVRGRRRYRTS